MSVIEVVKINKKVPFEERYKLAQSLKKYRQRRNMSQEELAQLIGTSVFSVSRWERAKHYPPRTTLKLMKIIGIL
ncbi:MAG: helix-turn-helix transcriptional regulator [Candidatus Omnitrophica bacterium]|nr:helix-turn-helix transcriptional regulator [Candidatus Omnitrophota bacterium]